MSLLHEHLVGVGNVIGSATTGESNPRNSKEMCADCARERVRGM